MFILTLSRTYIHIHIHVWVLQTFPLMPEKTWIKAFRKFRNKIVVVVVILLVSSMPKLFVFQIEGVNIFKIFHARKANALQFVAIGCTHIY